MHRSKEFNKDRLIEIEQDVIEAIKHNTDDELELLQQSFIKDDHKANDVLLWHKLACSDIVDLEDYLEYEIQKLQHYVKQRIDKLNKKRDFYRNSLKTYLKLNNKKNAKYPNGNVAFRKLPAKVNVHDEEKFMDWCFTNNTGDYKLLHEKKIKRTPALKEIKKYIKENGECPEGVEFVDGDSKFYIKTFED